MASAKIIYFLIKRINLKKKIYGLPTNIYSNICHNSQQIANIAGGSQRSHSLDEFYTFQSKYWMFKPLHFQFSFVSQVQI